MRRHEWLHERDQQASPAAARKPPAETVDRAPGVDPLGPTARSVLQLQNTAGNAAVASVLGGRAQGPRVLQRQPKPPKKPPTKPPKKKKPPKWLTDAKAELSRQFPNSPDMANVNFKDYADLNPVLAKYSYLAWTNSGTDIYIRKLDAQMLAYVIQHEARHIVQFNGAKGKPPATWQEMAGYELSAYSDDVKWLASPQAKKLIPSASVRTKLTTSASGAVTGINAVLNKQTTLTGQARQDEIRADMIAADMIPKNSPQDPAGMYKQP